MDLQLDEQYGPRNDSYVPPVRSHQASDAFTLMGTRIIDPPSAEWPVLVNELDDEIVEDSERYHGRRRRVAREVRHTRAPRVLFWQILAIAGSLIVVAAIAVILIAR